MMIKYTIRYKNYPNAPRATRRSYTFGRLTVWPLLGFYGFLWYLLFFALGDAVGMSGSTATVYAFVSLVAYVPLVRYVKRSVSERIDADAVRESQEMARRAEPSNGHIS